MTQQVSICCQPTNSTARHTHAYEMKEEKMFGIIRTKKGSYIHVQKDKHKHTHPNIPSLTGNTTMREHTHTHTLIFIHSHTER